MTHVVAVVLLPLGTGETARLNALRETVGAGLPVVLAGRGRDRRLTLPAEPILNHKGAVSQSRRWSRFLKWRTYPVA